MIKYFFCAFLPALITINSCGSPTPTTESDQETASDQQTEFPDEPQLEGSTADTTMLHDTASATPVDNVRVEESQNQRQQNAKEIKRITVSFISIGEGIDSETFKQYKTYLDNWSASGKKPAYETIGWGREGETDLCIDMSNISDTDAKKLLAETREKLKNNSLVQIETNHPCRESHIRK